jgi:hypothetical protein
MNFLLPTGIGDSVWAIHKCQAIRDKLDSNGTIDISLVGANTGIDSRAMDFVRRFSFVDSVSMKPYSIQAYGPLVHPDGTYNYIQDGWYEFNNERYCALIPNASLEKGIRLEDWLPQYEINWDIFKYFRISDEERLFASKLYDRIGPYVVFYPGPLHGNTVEGHNRGPLWTPQDWVGLGKRIHNELNLQIVLVGAPYDAAYYDSILSPALNGNGHYYTNLIGKTNLGQLWSVTSNSKFVVSYQAGVGIISTYLGIPTAIFWRPHGNSISASHYLTFDERMASGWVPPEIIEKGTHLPLIYGRHSTDFILDEVRRRKWADSGS